MKQKSHSAFRNPFLSSLAFAVTVMSLAGHAQAAPLTWSDTGNYSAGWTAWTTWTPGWDGNTTGYVNGSDVVFNGGGGSNVAVWETQHYNVGSMSFSGKDYFVGTTPGTGLTASLTLTNGNIDVASGTTTTFVNNAGSGQFALHGSAGITKTGAGALVLSAPSDITGTVTVSAGKLQIGNGTMDGSIATTSGIANSAAVEFKVIGSQSYAAGISGTGTLTKSGAGSLELAGTNTYSGTTYISGGTLSASVYAGAARHYDASTLGLANGADITTWTDLSGNGANATVPGGNDNPTYIANAGTGTGLGAVSFLGNTGATDSQALTFSRDTNVRSVFSIFKGSSFLLTDTQGQYDLHRASDTNPADPLISNYGQVDYLGAVYVNGTAVNPTVDAMPTASNNGYNLVEIITNGTPMQLDSFNKDRTYHSGDQSHAETILFDTAVSETQRQQIEAYLNKKWFGTGSGIGNLMSTTSDIVLSSGGKLDLSGQNYQTLKSLSAADNSGTQVVIGAVALTVGDAASTTFDGVITGSGGSLTKVGEGTLTLSGANTYSGSTTVSAGTLNFSGTNTIGTVNANGGSTIFSGGNTTINGNLNLNVEGASGLSFTGGVVTMNQLNFAVTGNPGEAFTISGTAEVHVNGGVTSQSWRGSSGMFLNGGTLLTPWIASNSSTTPWLNDRAYIHFNGTKIVATQDEGNFIRLAGGANYGSENFAKLDATTTFDTAGHNVGIGVELRGAGGLTKDGGGALTLNGVSTYTGATTVSAGTLLVNGELGNTAVTVGSSGTIGGSGSIAGSLNFDAGANFTVNLADPLFITGAVTFDGFDFTDIVGWNYASAANGIYTLLAGSGINLTNVAHVGSGNALDLGDGRSAYFQSGSLQVVVIPEPRAALIGGLGLLALLRRRR
jgi:fibronectin-binding autotransporter adhesin